MLKFTGMKQEELTPLYNALKMMVEAVPEGYVFQETKISQRMDEYLEANKI